MNIPDREAKLAYNTIQMKERELLILYWIAMANTGVATRRNMSQGREPTPEEKVEGRCIGWRPLTDEEKIAERSSPRRS